MAMLDNLKARLGFGNANDEDYDSYDDYDDEPYDDEGVDAYSAYSDNYNDFGNYDEYSDYGSDYSGRATASAGAYRPLTTPSSRRTTSPRLVSLGDVKEATRIPDRLRRDPLADAGNASDGYRVGDRTVYDETAPAPSTPAANAAARERGRSEGLDSLFTPTTTAVGGAASEGYDPYEAYASATPATYSPNRSVKVLKPVEYSEVEGIAKAVKAGDVVVLQLRNTPDSLAKRILDFSFGVSAALDASVECPTDKVFAIARGNALTDAEKANLRGRGVL